MSGKAAGAAGAACKQLLPLQAGLAHSQKKFFIFLASALTWLSFVKIRVGERSYVSVGVAGLLGVMMVG